MNAPSVGSALLKFALAGLAALAVLTAISALVLNHLSQSEATKRAKQVTQILGRSVVQPVVTDGLLRMRPAAEAKVDRVVRRNVLGPDVARVKIWTAGGRIVYSDKRALIGSRYGLGADERTVLRTGAVESDVSDLSRPENRFDRGLGKLLEVYMPISTPSGRRLLFETYQPYSSVAASGHELLGDFAPALIAALVAFELIQLPLAWSLARRIQRQQAEREALLRRAIAASDLERRRIAADLHDGIVQELVGASYALDALREAPSAAANGQAERLERAATACRNAVSELRGLLVDIYPPRLHDAGLGSAIEDLTRPLAGQGTAVSVDVDPELALGDETEELFFRIAQEAIRNAGEHAGASHLDVRVFARDGRAVLEVADDGRGFEPGEALARSREGHFGLRLLADRARDGGAELAVDSTPGVGTTVRVEAPRG